MTSRFLYVPCACAGPKRRPTCRATAAARPRPHRRALSARGGAQRWEHAPRQPIWRCVEQLLWLLLRTVEGNEHGDGRLSRREVDGFFARKGVLLRDSRSRAEAGERQGASRARRQSLRGADHLQLSR